MRYIVFLGGVLALRLLGIFMLLPVFSVYALEEYRYASYSLVGIAFGIYAISQALFQIPFGKWSDQWGRKRVLLVGIFLLAVGSLLASLAEDIYTLILARFIQGSGAISGVGMALIGDLSKEEERTSAYMITGIFIGSSFGIGSLLGPLLASLGGLRYIFLSLVFLAFFSLILTWRILPEVSSRESSLAHTSVPLKNLLPIFFSMGSLSFLLNSFFLFYPILLKEARVSPDVLWKIYSILLIPSLILFPIVRILEKKGKLSSLLYLSSFFLFLIPSLMLSPYGRRSYVLFLLGSLFFLSYTAYQPVLPSLLSKRVPPSSRGFYMSLYNLINFLSASLGSVSAGFLMEFSLEYPIYLMFLFPPLLAWQIPLLFQKKA